MLHESSLSDPTQEEAFAGGLGGGVDPVVEEPEENSPPAPATRDRGLVVALGTMGVLVAIGLGLIALSSRRADGDGLPSLSLKAGEKTGEKGGDGVGRSGAKETSVGVSNGGAPIKRSSPAWRVANLKGDPNLDVVEGTFSKRGLVATLTQAGISRPEIRRLAQAFRGTCRLDRPRESDKFAFARDKDKGELVAFEFATSPMDIWQGRVDEKAAERPLVVKKVDLLVEHKRVAHGFTIGADLAAAISSTGMRPEIVDAIDEALEAHVEPGSIRAGARMRVATTEDWVEGAFVQAKVDAIEFVPKSGSPLRVYYYERDPSVVAGSPRRAPAAGFYDARAKQPYRGQFRFPLTFARVTSRFNPKRLHPVLKTVMPHRGVDFGAAPGTPVYASAAGTVISAGNSGPCGNMVEIDHGGGIRTAYCHLKGFAQGLRSGQKVESRQLVGYVGQTGRATGPHLHFAVKKNGAFIDPLTLKMDGVRVLPPADRDVFARRRAELDAVIDGVMLPSAANVPDEDDEDKDLHGD